MEKIGKLIANVRGASQKDRIVVKEDESVLKVNTLTSSVAQMYEKLRTVIDYNEEHLLRKNAIFRILKRPFLDFSGDIKQTSEFLIKELISAGYLPNEKLPESMKLVIAEILSKYQLLIREIQDRKGVLRQGKEFVWIQAMAAAEIEEKLAPSHQEKVYIKFLFDECKKRFEIDYPSLDEKTRDLYLYVAVNRSLVKSDRAMLHYFLLRLYYPQWKDEYESVIPYIAENINEIKEQLEEPIDNKLVNKLIKKIHRYSVMTQAIKAVVESEDTDIPQLADGEYLRSRVETVTLERYKTVRKRLSKQMSRAIIYIFFTKMLLALAIEVPLDSYIYGEVHVVSLMINVLVPVVLMILIALSISSPGKKNTDEMVQGVVEMLDDAPSKVEYVRPIKARSFMTKVLFNVIYVIAFLIPFYFIVKVLAILNFSILSMILFIVFLSIVSFFGVRIRYQMKDLVVLKKKETFMSELVDFFTTPIIRFGRWLSLNFSKVNVFTIFLDLFVEAPLKIILQVLDDWFGFVKEKKDDY
jgi:hypothetical protein